MTIAVGSLSQQETSKPPTRLGRPVQNPISIGKRVIFSMMVSPRMKLKNGRTRTEKRPCEVVEQVHSWSEDYDGNVHILGREQKMKPIKKPCPYCDETPEKMIKKEWV